MKQDGIPRLARELAKSVLLTLATALAVALGMHVFIYPGNFAPSGVDGIATMLYHISGINAGFFILAINLPLLIAAWFVLNRRYVWLTLLYTTALSFFLVLLEQSAFFRYEPTGERLMSAFFGGAAQGLTGMMLRLGASSGGIDVVACMIQKRMPHKNVESIISVLGLLIVGSSWFVYRDLEALLLSVVEIVLCERVTAAILRKSRSAVQFEVIGESVEELGRELLLRLSHGVTVLDAKGLYTGEDKRILICVVHHRQIPQFLRIAARYPKLFVYYSDVMGVRGNWTAG